MRAEATKGSLCLTTHLIHEFSSLAGGHPVHGQKAFIDRNFSSPAVAMDSSIRKLFLSVTRNLASFVCPFATP